MRNVLKISTMILIIFIGLSILNTALPAGASSLEQQPTVSIPTVTGTPTGPIAIVWSDPEEQINVRSGPGVFYPQVGILQNRQEVPALGTTPGGLWVQIRYPGVEGGIAWVYAPLIRVTGELPYVESPPTPTPLVTPTLDPTLAAQFVVQLEPTRLPTFTPPPPLIVPTFTPATSTSQAPTLPMGLIITGLTVVGFFGLVLALIRRR